MTDINHVIILHVVSLSVSPCFGGGGDGVGGPGVCSSSSSILHAPLPPNNLLVFVCVCVCVCVGVFVCVCGMLSPALSPGEKSKRNPLEFNQAGLKKASVSKAIKVTTR